MKITAAQLRRIIKEERVLYHISHKDKAKIDTYADEKRAREEYEKLNPTWGPDTGVTLTRKNLDGKTDTWTSSGIWSNEFPSVRKVPSATTEGKTMKIKLGTLRKIIKEEVSRALSESRSDPEIATFIVEFPTFGAAPWFSRFKYASDKSPYIAEFDAAKELVNNSNSEFNMRTQVGLIASVLKKMQTAGRDINFTGEELARGLQNAVTSRVSHRKPHPDNPNNPNYVYDPATGGWKDVGLGRGGG